MIDCYYQEQKDSKYISILEDFCDDNNIDLNLYEAKIKNTPKIIFYDDFGIEIQTVNGTITRQKLKDIYNEALY